MALREIPYRPGVVKDEEDLTAGPYATDSNLIVWRNGRAQAAVGWKTRASNLVGDARAAHEWASIAGEPRLAIATTSKLYVYSRNAIWDITPFRAQGDLPDDPLSVTSGSNTVTITLSSHGLSVGDVVYLRGLSSVAGVKIGGRIGTLGSDPFRATSGSTTLVVTHTAHDMADGDRAHFTGSSDVGGILAAEINRSEGHAVRVVDVDTYTIETDAVATSSATSGGASVAYAYAQPYTVIAVPGASTFQVPDNSTASSTTTGGGTIGAYQAEISAGRKTTSTGGGFGSGRFGAGKFGAGEKGGTGSTSVPAPLRLWSLDNLGEQLIANIRGGRIYRWTGNLGQRAATITNAPARCLAIAVTPERYLLACGCDDAAGTFDPLLIRFPDPFDITDWSPSLTDNSGDLRLSGGSRVMTVKPGRDGPLILTDTHLYGIRFVGDVDQIYDADEIGSGCGALSPNAACSQAGELYWISSGHRPWVYRGGRPDELPCPVSQWFKDESLNLGQQDKLHARFDIAFRAVEWHYPSKSSMEVDSYIRVDLPEAERDPMAGWSLGRLNRLCWSQGQIFPSKLPFAVGADGKLYEHGATYGADGAGIERFVRFAPFDGEDGNTRVSISRLVLDLEHGEAMDWTWRAREWPEADEWVRSVSYTVGLLHADLRIAGRQVGGELRGTTSSYWRLGKVRVDVSPGSSK